MVCAECLTEVVPTIPKPKSGQGKKASFDAGKSMTILDSPPSRSSTDQSDTSVQAVVKAWSDSTRKWRVDEAHLTSKTEPVANTAETTTPSTRLEIHHSARKPSGYHLILFGVFVFLAGHGLTIWAFLAGHFGAWTIGSFCSVGGVTIAVISVVQALKDLEHRIANSAKNVKGTTKTVRRVKRKKMQSRTQSR